MKVANERVVEAISQRLGPDLCRIQDTFKSDLQLPKTLEGLLLVAENLVNLEPKLSLLEQRFGHRTKLIVRWAREVDGLKSDQRLVDKYKVHFYGSREGDRIRPAVQGVYTEHGVWAAMWFQFWAPDPSSKLAEAYAWLQAQLLVASVLAERNWRETEDLRNPRRAAGRLIRNLHDWHTEWLLTRLEGVCHEPRALAKAVIHEGKRTSPDWYEEKVQNGEAKAKGKGPYRSLPSDLKAFGNLLSIAYGFADDASDGDPKRRGKRTENGRLPAQFLYPHHAMYWSILKRLEDVQLWKESGTELGFYVPGTEARNELLDAAIDPAEFGDPEGAAIAIEDVLGFDPGISDLGSLPHLSTVFAKAAHRGRHIAVQNQRLRVARSRPRLLEIKRLVTGLNDVYRMARSSELPGAVSASEGEEICRAVEFAAACLVTGTLAHTVRNARIVKVADEDEHPPNLNIDIASGVWVRSYEGPERGRFRGLAATEWVPSTKTVVIPDAWGVLRWKTGSIGGKPFAIHQLATYEGVWGRHVRPLLGRMGVSERHQTFDGMAAVLPAWFRGLEEGEHIGPSMLFGQRDPLAATHQFYTAVNREKLAQRFQEVLDDLGAAIALPTVDQRNGAVLARCPADSDTKATIDPKKKSWVGDDRTPSITPMSNVLQQVRDSIAAAHVGSAYTFHNRLALYTALALVLVTGARAIRTPIPDLTAIHGPTRTLCLQEKDRGDGLHARLALLPQRVYDQVQIYLAWLQRSFLSGSLDMPTVLQIKASKSRDRSRYGAEGFPLDLRKSVFFWEKGAADEWRPVELTGKSLQQQCEQVRKDSWPIENQARHFHRTYLTELDVPSTVINTMMGHWHYGEEPWTAYSAMDPVRLRNEVEPILDRMLDHLKFEVVRI
nr:hypothetical protein [Thioalkalivibrio sp. AKL7]